MREIKFRCWHEGYKGTAPPVMLFDEKPGDCLYFLKQGQPVHVMQYTGLKDRHGKEIYEGDIVRVLYTDWPSKSPDDPRTLEQYQIDISKVGEIVFEGYEWCVKMRGKYGDNFGTFIVGRHGWMEVIGNIYENKDLL